MVASDNNQQTTKQASETIKLDETLGEQNLSAKLSLAKSLATKSLSRHCIFGVTSDFCRTKQITIFTIDYHYHDGP